MCAYWLQNNYSSEYSTNLTLNPKSCPKEHRLPHTPLPAHSEPAVPRTDDPSILRQRLLHSRLEHADLVRGVRAATRYYFQRFICEIRFIRNRQRREGRKTITCRPGLFAEDLVDDYNGLCSRDAVQIDRVLLPSSKSGWTVRKAKQ